MSLGPYFNSILLKDTTGSHPSFKLKVKNERKYRFDGYVVSMIQRRNKSNFSPNATALIDYLLSKNTWGKHYRSSLYSGLNSLSCSIFHALNCKWSLPMTMKLDFPFKWQSWIMYQMFQRENKSPLGFQHVLVQASKDEHHRNVFNTYVTLDLTKSYYRNPFRWSHYIPSYVKDVSELYESGDKLNDLDFYLKLSKLLKRNNSNPLVPNATLNGFLFVLALDHITKASKRKADFPIVNYQSSIAIDADTANGSFKMEVYQALNYSVVGGSLRKVSPMDVKRIWFNAGADSAFRSRQPDMRDRESFVGNLSPYVAAPGMRPTRADAVRHYFPN